MTTINELDQLRAINAELLEACHKARALLAGSIEETDQPIVERALRDAIAKAGGNNSAHDRSMAIVNQWAEQQRSRT